MRTFNWADHKKIGVRRSISDWNDETQCSKLVLEMEKEKAQERDHLKPSD